MSLFICLGNFPIDGCGNMLTDEERFYYERACEKCEAAWTERMRAWQRGATDAALDTAYNAMKPSVH